MNIFKALREDHDIQRKLSDELITTSGDSDKRRRLYYQLKHELEIHADAEEKFFYVPLIKDGSQQEEARHGVAEHHEMDEIIEEMDNTSFDSPAWLVAAKKLHHKIHHHLKDEEQQFFELAGKVLKEQKKDALGKDYQEEVQDKRLLHIEA